MKILNKLILGVSLQAIALNIVASATQVDVTQNVNIQNPVEQREQNAIQQIQFQLSAVGRDETMVEKNFCVKKDCDPAEITKILETFTGQYPKTELGLQVPHSQFDGTLLELSNKVNTMRQQNADQESEEFKKTQEEFWKLDTEIGLKYKGFVDSFLQRITETLWNYVRAANDLAGKLKRLELIPIPNSDTNEVYDKNYQEIIFSALKTINTKEALAEILLDNQTVLQCFSQEIIDFFPTIDLKKTAALCLSKYADGQKSKEDVLANLQQHIDAGKKYKDSVGILWNNSFEIKDEDHLVEGRPFMTTATLVDISKLFPDMDGVEKLEYRVAFGCAHMINEFYSKQKEVYVKDNQGNKFVFTPDDGNQETSLTFFLGDKNPGRFGNRSQGSSVKYIIFPEKENTSCGPLRSDVALFIFDKPIGRNDAQFLELEVAMPEKQYSVTSYGYGMGLGHYDFNGKEKHGDAKKNEAGKKIQYISNRSELEKIDAPLCHAGWQQLKAVALEPINVELLNGKYFSFKGECKPGDSGGPLVNEAGKVIANCTSSSTYTALTAHIVTSLGKSLKEVIETESK